MHEKSWFCCLGLEKLVVDHHLKLIGTRASLRVKTRVLEVHTVHGNDREFVAGKE